MRSFQDPKSSPYLFSIADVPPREWRETFIRTHLVPNDVRPYIAASWQRTLDAGVPLDSLQRIPRIPPAELRARLLQSADMLGEIRRIVRCFRGLYDGSPHAISYVDPDGVLLLATSLSPDALAAWEPALKPGLRFSESDAGTTAPAVALVTRQPVTVVGTEHLCDAWSELHCAAVPVWGPDDQPAGVLSVAFPLGVPAELYLGVLASVARCLETLKSYRLNLERDSSQKARVHVLDELSSITAHELRNPLTAIRATAELGMMFAQEDDRNHELFDRIVRGVDRLDEFISSLHSLGASTDEELAPGDVREPINGVTLLLQAKLASNGIRFTTAGDDDLPSVPFNDRLLRQALLNIVMNCIQAMPLGGHLRVTTERFAHKNGRDGVLISIEDSGDGIPPNVQEKLFRTAVTTKEQGNGIGLTITHQIVTKTHRGDLWFESEVGKGTTFYIFLPAR